MSVHAAELNLVALCDASLPEYLFNRLADGRVHIAGAAELSDRYEEIHVVRLLGRYPELDLHVAGELGILVKGDAKGGVAALRGVVGDLSSLRSRGAQGTVLGIQVEFLVIECGPEGTPFLNAPRTRPGFRAPPAGPAAYPATRFSCL